MASLAILASPSLVPRNALILQDNLGNRRDAGS